MGVAVVQNRIGVGNNVTSVAVAFSSNNAAGNLLVYFTHTDHSTGISAATDSNTNTIANATTVTGNGTSGDGRADYVANSHSGANTATGHQTSSSGDIYLGIYEVSGCVTTSPVRDSGTVVGSATASVSTAGTSTQTGDAVLASFGDAPNSRTLVVGSGYSSFLTTTGANGDCAAMEFKAATASGTQTATITGNSTDQLDMIIVTFIASGATVVIYPTDQDQQFEVSDGPLTSVLQEVLSDREYDTLPPNPPVVVIMPDLEFQSSVDWRAFDYSEERMILPPIPPVTISTPEMDSQIWTDWRALDFADERSIFTPAPPVVPTFFDDGTYQNFKWAELCLLPVGMGDEAAIFVRVPFTPSGDIWLAKHRGTRIILPGYEG